MNAVKGPYIEPNFITEPTYQVNMFLAISSSMLVNKDPISA